MFYDYELDREVSEPRDVSKLLTTNINDNAVTLKLQNVSASWNEPPVNLVLNNISFEVDKVLHDDCNKHSLYVIIFMIIIIMQDNCLLAVVGSVGSGKVKHFFNNNSMTAFIFCSPHCSNAY